MNVFNLKVKSVHNCRLFADLKTKVRRSYNFCLIIIVTQIDIEALPPNAAQYSNPDQWPYIHTTDVIMLMNVCGTAVNYRLEYAPIFCDTFEPCSLSRPNGKQCGFFTTINPCTHILPRLLFFCFSTLLQRQSHVGHVQFVAVGHGE